ncbi:helix-turn-helix domain-containing protein [Streptomyces sp. NPDC059816]|uniref:helix-turn-helix domain-containing protein n=1 Tax=Streptomyces sp. NPDC059816 TaxID=3346960 RepID=UPI00364DDEAA
MTEGHTGSAVLRRQLGRNLRTLRGRARLTVRSAATKLDWSETKMWRIETGHTTLRALDVQAMCMTYGAPADLTQTLMDLATEAKSCAGWHSPNRIAVLGNAYTGLEEAAHDLATYESDLVPGLLQTRDYARAIICAHYPAIAEDDLAGRVRLRMERQAILTRATDPTPLRVALSETAVRYPVGGPEAMARQLAHLVYMSGLSHISLRVVPFTAGPHPGVVTGPFMMQRFRPAADGTDTEPTVVYADGYVGGRYFDRAVDVERYEAAWAGIWAAALDEQATQHLLAAAARSHAKPSVTMTRG